MTIERVNNKSVISFEEKSGNTFSLMLAASGVFAFSIHSYFILNGRTEFTQPASLALLVIILIISLVQGFVAFSGMLVTDPRMNSEGIRKMLKVLHFRWFYRLYDYKFRRRKVI